MSLDLVAVHLSQVSVLTSQCWNELPTKVRTAESLAKHLYCSTELTLVPVRFECTYRLRQKPLLNKYDVM